MTYYFDVDGVLADFHSAYDPAHRAQCTTYSFIRNLKAFNRNVTTVKSLIADGHEIYISTMVANEEPSGRALNGYRSISQKSPLTTSSPL